MMKTNTVTRFGNVPAAATMQPGAGAAALQQPQNAALQAPPQDVASFSSNNAPATATSVQFGGDFWNSAKNVFKTKKADVTADFNLKAERKKAETMLKERERLPARIEEKKDELIERKKAALNQVSMQHGPLNTLVKLQRKMESELAALQQEQLAVFEDKQAGGLSEAMESQLGKELVRLEDAIDSKQKEIDKHQEKVKAREAIVEMFDMQLEVIEEAIQDANEMLDEALHAFEMAKLLDERLKVEEELSLTNEGVLGEVKKMHAEATSYEGEKKAAVEHYIGMSVEQQLEERKAQKELATSRAQRKEQNALETIEARLAQQRAEAKGEKVAEKTEEAG